MLDYAVPSIRQFSVERCNSDGSAARLDGAKVRYSFQGSVTALNNKNGLSCVVYYKLKSASAWTTAEQMAITSYSLSAVNKLLTQTYDALNSYDLKVRLSDPVSGFLHSAQNRDGRSRRCRACATVGDGRRRRERLRVSAFDMSGGFGRLADAGPGAVCEEVRNHALGADADKLLHAVEIALFHGSYIYTPKTELFSRASAFLLGLRATAPFFLGARRVNNGRSAN